MTCQQGALPPESVDGGRSLWIVGLFRPGKEWEFCGVFATESLAVAECVTCLHFVGPAKLNESLGVDTIEWIGAYYPLAQVPA